MTADGGVTLARVALVHRRASRSCESTVDRGIAVARGAAFMPLLLVLMAAAPSPQPAAAVWLEPLPLLFTLVSEPSPTRPFGHFGIMGSLGANFVVRELELFVAAGAMLSNAQSDDPEGGQASTTAGWLSVGPTFRFGSARLQGFFLSPKILLGYFHTVAFPGGFGVQATGGDSLEVQMGVDAGYSWVFGGHFFLGFVLGVSGGYATGARSWLAEGFYSSVVGARRPGLIVGAELHLLRLGVAF
jgi:hypothetical protein